MNCSDDYDDDDDDGYDGDDNNGIDDDVDNFECPNEADVEAKSCPSWKKIL